MQLTPTQIDTAKSVISNPQAFTHQPWHLQTAWATLKEARGQTVDFNRLPDPQYIVEDNAQSARISKAVHKRAATIGHHRPIRNGAA